jgi:hypothetical protein
MKRSLIWISIAVGAIASMALAAAAATAAKPTEVQITVSATPTTITYGQTTDVSGKVTGALKANQKVTLEANPAPYTGGYDDLATAFADTSGDYRFAGVKPLLNTRYRVSTGPVPQGTSSELLLKVKIKVVLRLSDTTPRRGQRVRFYGTAAPEHDGRVVYIQRRSSTGSWRTVSRTVLRDAGTEVSAYSKRIRVRRNGTYRARVYRDGDHATGTSGRKRARVH